MKKYLIIPFIPLCCNIQAQHKPTYEENFNDNTKGWYIGENEYSKYKIEDGKYIIERKVQDRESFAVLNDCPIDESKDYYIESTITEKANSTYPFGIIWGAKDLANRITFTIDLKGNYKITKIENGIISSTLASEKSDAILRAILAPNKISIRKEGGTYKFLINDILVSSVPYQNLLGQKIGFEICDKQEINIDNILVYDNNLPRISENIAKGVFISSGYRKVFDEPFDFNVNNWPVSSDENAKVEVWAGLLSFDQKLNNSGSISYIPVNFSSTSDFIIETMITKSGGTDDSYFGIIWGALDANNQFQFTIDGNGEYGTGKVKDNVSSLFNSGTSNAIIKNNSTNVLDICKKGEKLEFYINGQLVNTSDFQPFFGNLFGIIAFDEIKIDVRSFKIYSLIQVKGKGRP